MRPAGPWARTPADTGAVRAVAAFADVAENARGQILVQDRIEEPERRSQQLVETRDQARPHRRRGARSADAPDGAVGAHDQDSRFAAGDSRDVGYAAANALSGVARHRDVRRSQIDRQRDEAV